MNDPDRLVTPELAQAVSDAILPHDKAKSKKVKAKVLVPENPVRKYRVKMWSQCGHEVGLGDCPVCDAKAKRAQTLLGGSNVAEGAVSEALKVLPPPEMSEGEDPKTFLRRMATKPLPPDINEMAENMTPEEVREQLRKTPLCVTEPFPVTDPTTPPSEWPTGMHMVDGKVFNGPYQMEPMLGTTDEGLPELPPGAEAAYDPGEVDVKKEPDLQYRKVVVVEGYAFEIIGMTAKELQLRPAEESARKALLRAKLWYATQPTQWSKYKNRSKRRTKKQRLARKKRRK